MGFLLKGLGRSSVEWVKKENDKGFIDRALKMDVEGVIKHTIENDSACSGGAAASAISTCKALGAERGILLDYYTSYDIMPMIVSLDMLGFCINLCRKNSSFYP